MKKAEKNFRLSAVFAVFILLTVLLAIINVVNFTVASQDADKITEMISGQQGSLRSDEGPSQKKEDWKRMGPMGPSSPEVTESVRYFTVSFSETGGNADLIAYKISAVSEDDAIEWAQSLVKENIGWTRGTYRYRVYSVQDKTYVTVIDQGRELLGCYRILIISIIGDVLCVLISWIVLRIIGRKLFAPLEEADRKQKKFIDSANRELRVPLTIISADTELIERTNGSDDQTRSIRRQVGKLNTIVKRLGSMGLFNEEETSPAQISLSEFLRSSIDSGAENFSKRNISVESDIMPDIQITADPDVMRKVTDELVDNALKYALTKASFTLKKEGDRILLEASNDAALFDGPADQVFDRFTTLENAAQEEGAGLGLAYVKDAVKACSGRVNASVSDGMFTLRIAL